MLTKEKSDLQEELKRVKREAEEKEALLREEAIK